VAALLDDPAGLQIEDASMPVMVDSRCAIAINQCARHEVPQRFLDQVLGFGVDDEVASSRIRIGVLEQRAGDRDALLLAADSLMPCSPTMVPYRSAAA